MGKKKDIKEKKDKSRSLWIRIGLILGATAIILALLPRGGSKSYNYELNQPWRYPLLTADFDMPILRDSVSARQMHDSIDKNFVPFVKRDGKMAHAALDRFYKAMAGTLSASDVKLLSGLMEDVYGRGVVERNIYEQIRGDRQPRLRISGTRNGEPTVETIDASQMLSPAEAFAYIDSAYNVRRASVKTPDKAGAAKALSTVLLPNVLLDTVNDKKYREQEYLTVNAATGIIKKGQRIVDRGEIVTPQVYTNLNTYMTMLERNDDGNNHHTYYIVGQGIYILLCFAGLFVFLSTLRALFYDSDKKMLFLMSFITLFVIFSILMFEYVGTGLYFVPYAMVPVVIMVFFDSRTAIFSLLVTVMVCALVAVYPLEFIFMELTAGLTAALSLHTLSNRSQLLRTAGMTFVAYVLAYVAMEFVSNGDLSAWSWRVVGAFAINAVILSFTYILVLVIEKIFGFTSTVTLVELSDINNPLLRRLAQEAPGTFQHSMQVSTLAAEAARAIDANTQLVRTGALYHDIGKLESPIFFTENQHGVNPHTGLNPETSAHKIISHVKAGLDIAQHAKLPAVVRHFISEHHGKSLTRYFYNTAVNENGVENVDKSKFMYPGPNPQTRETAILMMADSVEAASRSLKDYSAESINNLVDKIIDTQMADGLYNESPISFRDIQTIKKTFKRRLGTIYHSRVEYPELKKETQPQPATPPETEHTEK